MEYPYLDSIFQAYQESYKHRNLEIKEINQSSCQHGLEWAWLTFGECLLTTAHRTGYLIGALSLPFGIVGVFMMSIKMFSTSAQTLWNLLIIIVVIDSISLTGAVISMQVAMVIWLDLIQILVLLLLLVILTILVLVQNFTRDNNYQKVCDIQTGPVVSTPANQNCPRMMWMAACLLPLGVFVLMLSILFIVATKPNRVKGVAIGGTRQELRHTVFLGICGYMLGCLACVGRWAVEVFCLRFASHNFKESGTNKVWKGGGVVSLISDLLYILGLLLQSGGVNVAMVTLPWIMGRVLHAAFQIFKLESSALSSLCQFEESDVTDDFLDNEMKDETIYDENINLLGSSDSELSDVHVLWDRSWNIPGKAEIRVYDTELPSKRSRTASEPRIRAANLSRDVTSTTESDWSSTSQEQELEWDTDQQLSRVQHMNNGVIFYGCQRSSRTSRVASLDLTSSESYDQRVRSWISQSTPEEEVAPCLTLTLNLDTAIDTRNNSISKDLGQWRANHGLLPLSPRKNSF